MLASDILNKLEIGGISSTSVMLNEVGEGNSLGIPGAFDFSEECLVKIPTVGPEKWVKSNQTSPCVVPACCPAGVHSFQERHNFSLSMDGKF